eukprot:TRINITY_DN4705_c0_g1_i1.p1 TRINITY_DN4705_c0_g1~~TRINITY_DN4705_c0_g1_i1.p1  ORF type:complete len:392 (+),score=79.24 TRINITY_DN4705_c0_g1_i1:77-1252(+)
MRLLFIALLLLINAFHTSYSSSERALPSECIPETFLGHLQKGTWNCVCESLESIKGNLDKKTVITMQVPGRLGNRMLVFALMLAFKRVLGLRVYLHSNVLEDINHYFPSATQIPSLERHFCLPFEAWDYMMPEVQSLNATELSRGHTIAFWTKLRLMDSILNERLQLMDFLKKVEPELRRTFVFKEDIQNYVSLLIQQATDNYKENYLRRKKKKHKKPPNLQRLNITLVGVHVRKRDADVSMVNRYNLPKLSPSYYLEAMHLYQKKFKNVIFMVVSDEMKWVEDNLLPRRGSAFIYPAGHGHVNCRTSVALDLALLAACHHTILSYGTFSFWGGWLSGGHRILPNHVFDVTPMDDPFDNTLNSFRLPDVGTLGLSNEQKMSLGRSSFQDID